MKVKNKKGIKNKESNKFVGKIKVFMSNKKALKILVGVLCLIVVVVITIATIDYFKDKKVLENSSIDLKSETYKGKKIEVKGNQVIIYEENGSKTIETVDNKKEEMTKATEQIKDKFKINNISIKKESAKTTVTGTIKASTDEYTKVIISAKFFRNNQLAATASDTIVEIKKNNKYDFEMNFVGDYSDCTSTVEVEYVK